MELADDDDRSRPWSNVPIELLDLIIANLSFSDHVCFGAVCMSWRSAAVNNLHHQALRLPWFLFPSDSFSKSWSLFSPIDSDDTAHRHQISLCDSPYTSRIYSSMGWLIVFDDIHGHRLLHPFTSQRIPLPHKSCLNRNDKLEANKFCKTILSAAPSAANIESGKCLVVSLCDCGGLLFCRPGDVAWSVFPREKQDYHEDIVFINGKLYSLVFSCRRRLGSDGRRIEVLQFVPEPVFEEIYDINLCSGATFSSYLAESDGEILMLRRYWKLDETAVVRTGHFRVFKRDPQVPGEWVSVTSLGDKVIFLGNGCCRSLAVTDSSAFKPNCIYYASDSSKELVYKYSADEKIDCGFFSLEDGEIQTGFAAGRECLRRPWLWFVLPSC